MKNKTLLSVEDLCVIYNDSLEALQGLSFKLDRGERVAVIGHSGSGKSTLLKSINLLIQPHRGRIAIDDQVLINLKPRQLRELRRSIGLIFQDYNLVDRLTVLENVLLGRLGYKSYWQSLFNQYRQEEYQAAIDAIDACGLNDKILERADALSGGQRQRVAIAKTLCQQPRLILADEPLAALDPLTAESILKLFCALNEERNIAILMNLHDVRLAIRYFPRIIALQHGKLIYDGPSSGLSDALLQEIYHVHADLSETKVV
ncbi:MAG: phosphonate ABC transporter ATP-binding protein [Eubacteriales bacterium]|nr:phosphonate ABC transporter ATP-binding protein [Eubacteriales bacterium]